MTGQLNKLVMLLETTASRLTKQAEGYDASTKFLLEKNNLVQARVNVGSSDSNYKIYETKVDKLASRINDLETNLKLCFNHNLHTEDII